MRIEIITAAGLIGLFCNASDPLFWSIWGIAAVVTLLAYCHKHRISSYVHQSKRAS